MNDSLCGRKRIYDDEYDAEAVNDDNDIGDDDDGDHVMVKKHCFILITF